MTKHREDGLNPGNPIPALIFFTMVAYGYDQLVLGGQYTAQLSAKYNEINAWLNSQVAAPQASAAASSVAGAAAGGLTVWQAINLIGFAIIVVVVIVAMMRNQGKRTLESSTKAVGKDASATDSKPAGVGNRQSRKQRTASSFRRIKEI